jgi:WD40 repeat protein
MEDCKLQHSVMFSPDYHCVVSGLFDNTMHMVIGESEAELKGHSGRVYSITFSPDGSHVVSESADNTKHIWNVVTGESEADLRGHAGDISSLLMAAMLCLDHLTTLCMSGMWQLVSLKQS